MLGLYLYSLKFGHKSCNILSLLNKLTLQKKIAKFCDKNVFFGQKVKSQQQNKKIKHKNPCRSRDLLHPKRMRYHCTIPSQRR